MSGLSLAVALRDSGLAVDVYEANAEPPAARTFCGFEVEAHPFEAAVTHRWSHVRVVGERAHALDLARHPYAMIPGERFVAEARKQLEGSPVRLHFGQRIDDVAALDARHVFDSRPVAPSPDALLQVFRGRFVRTERPVFDPTCATLMDFRVDQSRGVHFLYVLPTSPRDALVEDTYFTRDVIDDATFARTLDVALEGYGAHEVLGTEGGVIPMSTAPAPVAPPGVTRIGLAGGVAKPSTGYAFAFAQRHARAIAEALAAGREPPSSVRASRDRFLDQVFLERLDAAPSEGHRLLERLFERNEGDRIARFLSEAATPRDMLAIMASLPFGPFAWTAAKRVALDLPRGLRG